MLLLKKMGTLPAALSLALLFTFVAEAAAQAGGDHRAPDARSPSLRKRRRGGEPRRRAGAPAAPAVPAPPPGQPRSVVSSVETYSYRQDSNTPLKVKLAPLGQVVIEFPANDPVYKVHPSKENFVAVDRLTDDSLITDPVVLRPGDGFRVGRKGETTPATIINLQMFSGAIIPVIVIPVDDIEQNTLRVAVTYDRDKVERTRQALGLAANLERLQAQASTVARASSSAPPAASSSAQPSAPAPTVPSLASGPAEVRQARYEQTRGTSQAVAAQPAAGARVEDRQPPHSPLPQPAQPPAAPPRGAAEDAAAPSERLVALTRDELLSVIRGKKAVGKFSKALHGLSIAAGPSREVDERTRLVVIAVRNTLGESVRLVRRQPDIAVDILDDRKRLVDTREVRCFYMQTTLRDSVLAPGEVGYYALVYESPILGTHEYLRARVAQVFAADAPATTDLAITAR